MKDAKGHGSDARGGNGQFQSRVVGKGSMARTINATKERLQMRAMTDARQYLAARTSNRGINPPAMYADAALAGANTRAQRTDMPVVSPHGRGVENATAGKKLA
jgi:hypothetical protein